MSAADIIIPVLAAANITSWPKYPVGGRARPTPLYTALTHHYALDAHCVQYRCPFVERRLAWLTLDTPQAMSAIGGAITMQIIMFDVDHGGSHAAGGAGADLSIEDWWALEEPKTLALNTFVYRTRGGYRAVFALPEPFLIRTRAEAEAWTDFYLCSVALLRRVYGIIADPTADWQRLFRLPHATRIKPRMNKAETVEEAALRQRYNASLSVDNYPIIGDARQIGVWA